MYKIEERTTIGINLKMLFYLANEKILNFLIHNGAKLGDASVARAPPLLCHPRNFIV